MTNYIKRDITALSYLFGILSIVQILEHHDPRSYSVPKTNEYAVGRRERGSITYSWLEDLHKAVPNSLHLLPEIFPHGWLA